MTEVAAPDDMTIHKKRGFAMNFLIAGAATSGACVLSNPMEVVKTRMQLPRKLAAKGSPKVYKNFFHTFYTILTQEGVCGLQRGLSAGIVYQVFMNGTRLGLYEPMQRIVGATDPMSRTFFMKDAFAAGVSGVVGAIVGSPFFLVKARIQAAGSAASHTHYQYSGMLEALVSVYKSNGVSGLFRGVDGAIPRVAVGSATQLATYTSAKVFVLSTGCFEDNIYAHFASSFVSGLAITTAMNPFDVVSTRLYAQKVVNHKGVLYDGVVDCFSKILRSEGLLGFYKGWTAHYLRLGPHNVFTFVLWEKFKSLASDNGL